MSAEAEKDRLEGRRVIGSPDYQYLLKPARRRVEHCLVDGRWAAPASDSIPAGPAAREGAAANATPLAYAAPPPEPVEEQLRRARRRGLARHPADSKRE
jgi:hypothetical protein